MNGIDVSRWQASTPNLDGLDFLFARATYGTHPDQNYAMHIRNAKRAGLVTGAYHFGRAGAVALQVTNFLDTAGDVDLYCLDLERDGIVSMSLQEASTFIAGVQSTGKACGLYHSRSGYPGVGQDWRWVADWSAKPTIPWDIWQYGGTGVDRDLFNGTRDELLALGRTTHAPNIGGEPMIKASGRVGSGHVVDHIPAGTDFTDGPGGSRIGDCPPTMDYMGLWGPDHRAVVALTGIPYDDKQPRPTIVAIASSRGVVRVKDDAELAVQAAEYAPTTVDCSGAVAAEHERTIQAVIAAVETL